MSEKYHSHLKAWKEKKILRLVYQDFYHKILSDLNDSGGPTVELGSGTANFKEFYPKAISSDIEPHPSNDMTFDAHNMPFDEATVSNLVMIDVLHHLENPIAFFNEAYRILKKKGKIIMVEPYPSPISLLIYRKFHAEPFLMDVNYFESRGASKLRDPWDSNQAIPYLLFFKYRNEWDRLMSKKFKIIKKERISCIVYPLSGGFEHQALVPAVLFPFLKILEYLSYPLRPLLAFRCYIVIEKI